MFASTKQGSVLARRITERDVTAMQLRGNLNREEQSLLGLWYAIQQRLDRRMNSGEFDDPQLLKIEEFLVGKRSCQITVRFDVHEFLELSLEDLLRDDPATLSFVKDQL